MAKIEHSGIGITNSRGRIGNVVNSRNRGGDVQRAYVVPVYPNTPNQQLFTAAFASIESLWETFPQQQQDEWNAAALKTYRVNAVGKRYHMSGYNFYISQTITILIANGSPSLFPAPPLPVLGLYSCATSTLTSTQLIVDLLMLGGFTVCPANHAILIYASDCVSNGINYKRTGLQGFFSFHAGDSLTAQDVFTHYTALYPAPVSGKKIFFKARVIHDVAGTSSPWFLWSQTVA
jgi:hypothetical protein